MVIQKVKLTLLKFTPLREGVTKGTAWKFVSGKVLDDEANVLSVSLGKAVIDDPKQLEYVLSLSTVPIIATVNIKPKGFDSQIVIEDFEVVS